MRNLFQAVEAALVIFCVFASRLLPVQVASWLGGRLLRWVGPFLKGHRTARANISRVMPRLSEQEVEQVLLDMWENLGRVGGEYGHLRRLADDRQRVTISDPSGAMKQLIDEESGAVLLSAHFGNWELSCLPGYRAGRAQHNVYRPLDNQYTDRALQWLRQPLVRGGLIPKGKDGGVDVMRVLRRGFNVGMVVDQRYKRGIVVPFLGIDALCTPAPAVMVQRLGVPIYIGMVERLAGARFRIHVMKLDTETGQRNRSDAIVEITRRINVVFEEWIRRRPDLWLWTLRRWDPLEKPKEN